MNSKSSASSAVEPAFLTLLSTVIARSTESMESASSFASAALCPFCPVALRLFFAVEPETWWRVVHPVYQIRVDWPRRQASDSWSYRPGASGWPIASRLLALVRFRFHNERVRHGASRGGRRRPGDRTVIGLGLAAFRLKSPNLFAILYNLHKQWG